MGAAKGTDSIADAVAGNRDTPPFAGLSIIVPVLDEAACLQHALEALQDLRQRGHELIVVDGGSRDGSLSIARRLADRVVVSGPGRALQMNAGAEYAKHETLLFLHADSTLPDKADTLIQQALAGQKHHWGRFDLRLGSSRRIFRLIEASINWRSAVSGIATGDQAIFVERSVFEKVGSYDPLPLMEDVALSKKLLRHGRPARIDVAVESSSRKWERDGILRTVLLMWRLRAAYFLGASPERLAVQYYQHRLPSRETATRPQMPQESGAPDTAASESSASPNAISQSGGSHSDSRQRSKTSNDSAP